MATLEQIIKDLQEIADSGTTGGNSASRRKAAEEAKKAIENAKKKNKLDNENNKNFGQVISYGRYTWPLTMSTKSSSEQRPRCLTFRPRIDTNSGIENDQYCS